VFYIDWKQMQLNVANPNTFGQFYVTNIGNARSEGVEFDINARPHRKVDIFGAAGLTRARFIAGSSSTGASLAGKIIPNTPGLTMSGGSQLSQELFAGLTVYGRSELWLNGGFEYDEANTQRQTSYWLLNYRIGLKHRAAFGEVWVKNAYDKRYIPIAFAYERFAPSGFIGEMGAPRQYGARLGFNF
jgi:iron complex outermembrane receptor protein